MLLHILHTAIPLPAIHNSKDSSSFWWNKRGLYSSKKLFVVPHSLLHIVVLRIFFANALPRQGLISVPPPFEVFMFTTLNVGLLVHDVCLLWLRTVGWLAFPTTRRLYETCARLVHVIVSSIKSSQPRSASVPRTSTTTSTNAPKANARVFRVRQPSRLLPTSVGVTSTLPSSIRFSIRISDYFLSSRRID